MAEKDPAPTPAGDVIRAGDGLPKLDPDQRAKAREVADAMEQGVAQIGSSGVTRRWRDGFGKVH